jgi:hypothetical protein
MLRRSIVDFGPPFSSELDSSSMTFEHWALQRILNMDTAGLAASKVREDPQDLSSRSATQPNRLEATDPLTERAAPPEPLAQATEEVSNQGCEIPPINQIGANKPEATVLVCDREIRVGKEDRAHFSIAPPPELKGHRTAFVTGTLLFLLTLGVSVGWLSRSTSDLLSLHAAPPTLKQVNSPGCAADSGKEAMCDTPKSDQPGTPNLTNSPISTASTTGRAHEASRGGAQTTNAVSLPTKQNTITLGPTTKDRAKRSTRPIAVAETRPTTIEGWTVRDVIGGTAILEGPNGIWRVTRGGVVPGVGKIDSIVRWGNRWIVATNTGLISTR